MTDPANGIRAILFDLDGTLIDSESETELAIERVMARHGCPDARIPAYETRGRTWAHIVKVLISRFGAVAGAGALEGELIRQLIELVRDAEAIPGAEHAIEEASLHLSIAIVSSSPTHVIDAFVTRLRANKKIPPHRRIGAEKISRAKPDPEGFLRAAQETSVEPARCVVFEDSRAGLEAANSAGMPSVAVLARCAEPEQCRSMATASIVDYRTIDDSIWAALARCDVDALRGLDA